MAKRQRPPRRPAALLQWPDRWPMLQIEHIRTMDPDVWDSRHILRHGDPADPECATLLTWSRRLYEWDWPRILTVVTMELSPLLDTEPLMTDPRDWRLWALLHRDIYLEVLAAAWNNTGRHFGYFAPASMDTEGALQEAIDLLEREAAHRFDVLYTPLSREPKKAWVTP